MLDARFSHLYFYQSLNRLQRGLSATAELLVSKCSGISMGEQRYHALAMLYGGPPLFMHRKAGNNINFCIRICVPSVLDLKCMRLC